MKTFFKRLPVVFVIALMAISCGKENSSGGGGSSSVSANVSAVAPSGSQGHYQEALTWYQSNEKTLKSVHYTSSQNTGAQTQGDNCNSWLGGFIQFCGSVSGSVNTGPQYVAKCIQGSSNSISIGDRSYSGNCTNEVSYSKSSNTQLKKLFELNGGAWTVLQAEKQGSRIVIYVGQKSDTGYQPQPTNVFVIDTALHSVHNPAIVHDLATGVLKRIDVQ